jgi:hypothetical protein
MQRLARDAAAFERQQAELAAAVQGVHAANIVDAEGYVRLDKLLEMARHFPSQAAFMNAVGACVVSAQRCQCWWCKAKRGIGRLLYLLREFCQSMYFWPQDYDAAVEDAVTALAGRDKTEKREERFYEITLRACTYNDWRKIVKKAVEQAKMGDTAARKFLADYIIGPPTQRQEISLSEPVILRVKGFDEV